MNLTKETITELVKRQIIQSDSEEFFHPDQKITTEEFITWIVRSFDTSISNPLTYATEKGFAEDYDWVHREREISRRQVARIVHDTLRIEMHEKDEDNWTAAKNLKDLYSCRTCVQHISQVYVKGILEPDKPNIYNVDGQMTRAEAADVLLKMIDRTKRKPKSADKQKGVHALSPNQARAILTEQQSAVLLDVRSHADYQKGHLVDSISLPLEEIDQVNFEKDTPIVLYCHIGYKSHLAAELLVGAGYANVYTIPGISDYQYELVK